MDSIIKIANDTGEFEIKVHSDDKTLLQNYAKAKAEPVQELSLNTIESIGKNITKRLEIILSGQNRIKKTIIKTKLRSIRLHHESVDFVLTYSTEVETHEPIGTPTIMRLKRRTSYTIGEWRWDFTDVLVVNPSEFTSIKAISDVYFAGNTTPTTTEFEVEFVGKGLTEEKIHNILDTLRSIVDTNYEYSKTIKTIATTLIPDKNANKIDTLKQLVNQPITLTRSNYAGVYNNLTEYYLTDKADGERCLVMFKNSTIIIITTTLRIIPIKVELPEFILDCEMVSENKILAFDCLFYKKPTVNLPLTERLAAIQEIIKLIALDKQLAPMIDAKTMILTSKDTIAADIKTILSSKTRMYEIDGIMFTPNTLGTQKYTEPIQYFDMKVYKMKPSSKQTIDFYVREAPEDVLAMYEKMPKHKLMFLFNGINIHEFKKLGLENPPGYDKLFPKTGTYFPTAFRPISNPDAYIYYHPTSIDGEIAELGWDNGWVFHKLRPDRKTLAELGKSYGNAYQTADMIYENYKNPLTYEDLSKPQDQYFAVTKSHIYKPLTRYNGFVKALKLKQLRNAEFIIDLAGGHGQDLFVYDALGVGKVLFVDMDKEALTELASRRYNIGKPQFYVYYPPIKRSAISINTMEADVKKLVELPVADAIVMNFAIHYIIDSPGSRDNFVKLITSSVKPGGLFIFSCFNGEQIFNVLKTVAVNESMDLSTIPEIDDIKNEDSKKFSIKKLYKTSYKPYGMKIGVIHPFSGGEYYEENILDIEWVLEGFKSAGWIVISNNSFGDFLADYDSFNKQIPMDKSDKIYTSLYSICTLLRK